MSEEELETLADEVTAFVFARGTLPGRTKPQAEDLVRLYSMLKAFSMDDVEHKNQPERIPDDGEEIPF